MRKANQEITDLRVLEEILTQSVICRIAMIDNGLPYILPFNYGYSGNCLYIHSAPEGKKIDLLRQNSTVCFEVEDKTEIIEDKVACKWGMLYRSIVGYGTVEIITAFEEKKRGLEIIMARHGFSGKMDFEQKEVEFIVILKLSISSMTGKQSGNWNKLVSRNR